MNEKIFVAGLGATGSSAVIDLLKEVNTYFVFENEFRLFVDPGGLVNLRDSLVYNWSIYQTDAAIKKFRKITYAIDKRFRNPYSTLGHNKYLDDKLLIYTDQFLNEITELDYDGLWYGIDNILKRQLNKYKLFTRKKIITSKIFVGKQLTLDQFNEIVNNYVNNIIDYCLKKYKAKHFCFNENFSCMFPEKITDMVEGSKMILVVRDPRDVYSTAIQNKWMAAPGRNEDFLKWEYSIFSRWLKIQDRLKGIDPEGKKFKVIKFEDLITDYEQTKEKIFDWCSISNGDHVFPKKYLDPTISKKNVGLWKTAITPELAKRISQKFENFYKEYNYEI